MKIATILETQLQQLGSRRVTEKEFLQAKRWGSKYVAYTSLTGSLSTFIFIGTLGSCRTGASPSAAKPNPFLREKLLHRHLLQQEHKKPVKAKTKASPLSLSDMEGLL